MIQASHNPTPCYPVVFGNNNFIIELGVINRNVNSFNFEVGFKWQINNQTYQNTIPYSLTPTAATLGNKRIDIAVLTNTNTIELIAGVESTTVALRPTIPTNTILLTEWNIDGGVINDNTPPILGTEYLKKSYYQHYDYNGTGADAVIPIPATGYTEIRLKNASLTSVSGFDASLLVGALEQPFQGKQFLLWNNTGNDVTIKHDDNAIADIPFFLLGEANIVMPDNQMMLLKYDAAGFYEVMKSWVASEVKAEKHLYAHYGFIYADTLLWQTPIRPTGQSFLTTLSANALFGSGTTPTNITISNTINLVDATKINKINFSYFLNSGTADLHVYIVVSDKNNANTQVLVDEVLASNSTNGTFCKQLNLNAHTILNADSKLRFFIRSTTGVPEAIYDIQTRYTYE